jgi:hypothetical protein
VTSGPTNECIKVRPQDSCDFGILFHNILGHPRGVILAEMLPNVVVSFLSRLAGSEPRGQEYRTQLKATPTIFHSFKNQNRTNNSQVISYLRSSLLVRASDCQCTSCNGPGFDTSIRRHSGILGAADEAVLNIGRKKKILLRGEIFISLIPFRFTQIYEFT